MIVKGGNVVKTTEVEPPTCYIKDRGEISVPATGKILARYSSAPMLYCRGLLTIMAAATWLYKMPAAHPHAPCGPSCKGPWLSSSWGQMACVSGPPETGSDSWIMCPLGICPSLSPCQRNSHACSLVTTAACWAPHQTWMPCALSRHPHGYQFAPAPPMCPPSCLLLALDPWRGNVPLFKPPPKETLWSGPRKQA